MILTGVTLLSSSMTVKGARRGEADPQEPRNGLPYGHPDHFHRTEHGRHETREAGLAPFEA
jgi:hypothetical protein